MENHIMIIKNRTVERARQMKEALINNNATEVDFAGMTYAQFCSGVAPSFEKRELYQGSLMNAAGERQEIDNADLDTVEHVVHSYRKLNNGWEDSHLPPSFRSHSLSFSEKPYFEPALVSP